jgi:hypothetical protein
VSVEVDVRIMFGIHFILPSFLFIYYCNLVIYNGKRKKLPIMATNNKPKLPNDVYKEVILPRLDEIRAWAIMGKSAMEICKLLDIRVSTFYYMLNNVNNLALKDAWENLTIVNDINVEKALYNRAVGFTSVARKSQKIKSERWVNGKKVIDEKIEYYDEETYYPPDIQAIKFYLTNRSPTKWRENQPEEMDVNELLAKGDSVVAKVREVALAESRSPAINNIVVKK